MLSSPNSSEAHKNWLLMMSGKPVSFDSVYAPPPTESSGAVDNNLTKTMQGMSLSPSSTHAMPPTESSGAIENDPIKRVQGMSLSPTSTHATRPTESSRVVDKTPPTPPKIENDPIKRVQGMSLSPTSTHATRPTESSRVVDKTPPTPPKTASLMGLPSELRLEILSHALTGAAGSSGTISVNPRAKLLSDPSGAFHEGGGSRREPTKWQVRRGLLQTCHELREEALEVLYNKNTFFARVTQYGEGWSFEVERFHNWLKSMGGDEELRRVKKVTFGATWASSDQEDVDYWEGKKGDVNIRIFKGKVTVGGSGNIVESPAAPLLKQVDTLITTLLAGKRMGEGLVYAEWMLVWAEIQDLTTKGWGQVGSSQ